MIEGGTGVESVVVSGSRTGFEVNRSGVGFSLQPVSSNARYPVHVYLDANTTPVVVQSAAWQGDTAFNKLRVDVEPAGGRAGDTWRLQHRPAVSDGEAPRLRTNAEGVLVTRSAGTRVLFDLDSRRDWAPFAIMADSEATAFYINPSDATQVSTTRAEAFDVSECSRLLFVVEQNPSAEIAAPWDFKPKVLGSATTDGEPVKEFTVGSVGQFGSAGSPAWDGQQGYLMLGAAADSSGDSWATNPAYFPAIRIQLNVPFDTTDAAYWQNTYNLNGAYVRLVCVAY